MKYILFEPMMNNSRNCLPAPGRELNTNVDKKSRGMVYIRWRYFHVAMIAAILLNMVALPVAAGEPLNSQKSTVLTSPYKDVAISDPNTVFIKYISQKGIINGFPDGTYHPSEGLTRAQAATVMARAAGLKAGDTSDIFKDVKAANWAAPYISAASKAGYMTGFTDGTFHPDEKLTRAQAMSMLMRLCTSKAQMALPELEDMKTTHWAANAMANALAAGMTGTSTDGKKVYPNAEISRAGMARALAILLTKDPGLYAAPLYGTVTEIKGNVNLTRNGTKSALRDKTSLAQGDTLSTGANSSARINYPDGSSTLIDANSEIYVKTSIGRAYIKKDGSPGTAVDSLDVQLNKGTLFGALATKNEEKTQDREQGKEVGLKKSAMLAALPSSRCLAEADKAVPWYKAAETKKVKVKVDMPWGVAAIRGTFIRATVFADGNCRVACLTGDAELQGTSGGSAALGQGQSSAIGGEGQAASPAAGFNADDRASFQQVVNWIIDTAVNMDRNQEMPASQPVVEITIEVPDNANAQNIIQLLVNALNSCGIQLNSNVIEDLRQQGYNIDKGNANNNNSNNNSGNTHGDSGTPINPNIPYTIKINGIPAQTVQVGKTINIPITTDPADAGVNASVITDSSPGQADLILSANTLSITGRVYGVVTIQVDAVKEGYTAAKTVFTVTVSPWTELGGTDGISDSSASALSLAVYGGIPCVGYSDASNSGKGTVKRFSDGSWAALGSPGFTPGPASEIALGGDNIFAYIYGHKVNVMEYAYGKWGDDHGATGESARLLQSAHSLVAYEDTITDMVYGPMVYGRAQLAAYDAWLPFVKDADENEIYFYEGTKPLQGLSMDYDPHDYVAYIDSGGGIHVKYPSDGAWEDIDTSDLAASHPVSLSLKQDNEFLYLAFVDDQDLTVAVFDGDAWKKISPIGNFAGSQRPRLFVDNGVPYLGFTDSQNWVSVLKYNTEIKDWEWMGERAFARTSGDLQLFVNDGTPYVAYLDADYRVHVMKYDFVIP